MKKKYSLFIAYLFLFIFLEYINKVLMFNKFGGLEFFYPIIFAIPVCFILTIISRLGSLKVNKIITIILMFLISFIYCFNYLYFSLLATPFSISVLELASQAMDFTEIALHVINVDLVSILIIALPFIMFLIYQNHFNYERITLKKTSLNLLLAIIFYVGAILSLNLDKTKLYSAYNLYYNLDAITPSTDVLGVFTTERLGIKRNLFGFEEKILLPDETPEEPSEEPEKPVSYNKIEIDFPSLILNTKDKSLKSLYEFLNNETPSNQNEYTGIYKGKNLIFILAEGFNSIAVDEERTPTLYKMIHEGFNFTNFYSPVFLSTTGGEFQATTSLIPTQEILGLWRNSNPTISYALGNAFKKEGYYASSYHDWNYKYYSRQKTMPTLGYDNYLACKNGLEKEMNCNWLPSDVDLIDTTFSKYANNTPFITYYISVSGHAPYNFLGGNSIASKNKKYVADLPYSDAVKAYLASQLELEFALTDLVNKLDTQGILDDTVIVLVGDHYPYTLTVDEINEISSYKRDETIEVNHSNLIIWNNKNMEITSSKVASQLDVLPTILNLFGINYDSRLLIGNDIFSDKEGLAIFSDRSWKSDLGTYTASNKKFVPNPGVEVPDNYVENMNLRIATYFTMSKVMIEKDIYKTLLGE